MHRTLIAPLMLFLLSLLLSPAVIAQEQMLDATSAAETETQEPEQEYTLPYPGILPDNPLYALKMVRDRIVGFLISDPLKKAEFNLLQADKRLAAAMSLMQKQGKEDIAEETVSKAENYLEQAIIKAKEAKQRRMETGDMSRRLFQSAKKHQQVIQGFVKKAKGAEKEKFTQLENRTKKLENIAEKLSKNK